MRIALSLLVRDVDANGRRQIPAGPKEKTIDRSQYLAIWGEPAKLANYSFACTLHHPRREIFRSIVFLGRGVVRLIQASRARSVEALIEGNVSRVQGVNQAGMIFSPLPFSTAAV